MGIYSSLTVLGVGARGVEVLMDVCGFDMQINLFLCILRLIHSASMTSH